MKYMLLVYGAEDRWTEAERSECMVESLGICNELKARGQFLDASPLQSIAKSVTVRVREGKTLVTDGPFAETTEQLGGFYVLDLPNLDAAIEVAARLPPAKKGTIEVRPMVALDGAPPASSVETAGADVPLYMLLCCHNEASWQAAGAEAHTTAMAEAAANCRELADAGVLVSASPLHPAATATCVRVREGKRLVTDGPFAETHEVLAGYYLIRADTRDEAVRIAARQPGARIGSMEVRPVFDLTPVRNPAREIRSVDVDFRDRRPTTGEVSETHRR